MKNLVKTVMASALVLGSTASAYAAVSGETTATADIAFSGSTPAVTLVLTSNQEFPAGVTASDTSVANGKITTVNAVQHAIRWTPGTFVADSQNTDSAIISGKDNSSHKLKLKFMTVGNPLALRTDAGYRGFLAPATEDNFFMVTDGEQTVSPDTYTVSVDAAIYNG